MSELPRGWLETSVGEVASDVTYGFTASADWEGVGPHMLRITDIQGNKVNWSTVPYCKISHEQKAHYLLRPADILFARTGATVGKSFRISGQIPESVFASYLIRVRCNLDDLSRYLAYYFQSPGYWEQVTASSAGTGQPNVNGTKLKELRFPLAPAAQQLAIANKLDKIAEKISSCRARLNRVPQILKKFREAVLEAAVSGKLTGEHSRKKEWRQGKLEQVLLELRNGLSSKPELVRPGTPILRISSVRPFRVSEDEVRYLRTTADIKSYEVRPNDLLFTRYSGSLEYVGVCGMVRAITSQGLVYPDKLMRVRVDKTQVLPDWIEIVANSPASRRVIERVARTSAGQTGISGRDLKALPVPIPLIDEQRATVRRVAELYALADSLERQYDDALPRIGKLTPSVLAKAFRGELVPQDPDDEPAEKMLERIRALSQGSEKNPTKAGCPKSFRRSQRHVRPRASRTQGPSSQ